MNKVFWIDSANEMSHLLSQRKALLEPSQFDRVRETRRLRQVSHWMNSGKRDARSLVLYRFFYFILFYFYFFILFYFIFTSFILLYFIFTFLFNSILFLLFYLILFYSYFFLFYFYLFYFIHFYFYFSQSIPFHSILFIFTSAFPCQSYSHPHHEKRYIHLIPTELDKSAD